MKAVIPQPRSWLSAFGGGSSSTSTSTQTNTDQFILSSTVKPCSFQPHQQPSSVLVQVHAASINPVDYKLPLSIAGKASPGIDFCGTVVEVGKDVSDIVLGDLVYGASTTGSLSEYTTAPRNAIAKALSSSSNQSPWTVFEYAAIPVAYQTSLQSLRRGQIYIPDSTPIPSSSSTEYNANHNKALLVIGASGGCGIAGLQLAQALQVSRIVAICSNKNKDFVLENGATEVVDYTQSDKMKEFFEKNVGQFDCILDAASNSGGGENYWDVSQPLLKPKGIGRFVALNGPIGKWIRELSGIFSNPTASILLCNSNTKDLELAVQLLDSINSRPIVQVYPFSEDGVKEAFETLKSRRTKGKIVLDVKGK